MSTTTAAPEKIRITDLANPQLSEIQQQAIAYSSQHEVSFTEEAILAAARERTGLSDFGAGDFRPRLRAWAEALDGDAGLTKAGRFNLWNEMVRFAATRLQVEDLVCRHPDILDVKIETPVVVGGLPRSGTTFLLHLLAGDRRLRSLPQWEAVRPIAEPFIKDGVDTRHELAVNEWAQVDAVVPMLKYIHEFSPDFIAEDIDLQCLDFGSYYIEWLAETPSWRDYYFANDQTPVYRYLRRVLQLLSWQRGPNLWVTKMPQYMEQLVAVAAGLPGATIAITHRDPLASIQSAITGVAYNVRMSRHRVDVRAVADYWIDRYERMLRGCVREHDQVDPGKLQDVYFHELRADPMGTLEVIYAKTGLPFDGQAQADIKAAIEANERGGHHGQLGYDLREDFGVDPNDVRERFSFYYDRFPTVRIEVS
jgi:hypothetical protein